MNVYIAACYERRREMLEHALQLEAMGHHVTSRWLLGGHDDADRGRWSRYATEDVQDLREADVLVFFSEKPGSGTTSGGRHVEFGIAFAMGLPIAIVGPRENVFHHLTSHLITQHDTWEDFSKWLWGPWGPGGPLSAVASARRMEDLGRTEEAP